MPSILYAFWNIVDVHEEVGEALIECLAADDLFWELLVLRTSDTILAQILVDELLQAVTHLALVHQTLSMLKLCERSILNFDTKPY